MYDEVIRTIKPDRITTVDGWTYEGTPIASAKEVNRCLDQTRALLALCPDIKVIGQVKGCTEKQIDDHIAQLKTLGIKDFIFHPLTSFCIQFF